jgi:hypothetical protein
MIHVYAPTSEVRPPLVCSSFATASPSGSAPVASVARRDAVCIVTSMVGLPYRCYSFASLGVRVCGKLHLSPDGWTIMIFFYWRHCDGGSLIGAIDHLVWSFYDLELLLV